MDAATCHMARCGRRGNPSLRTLYAADGTMAVGRHCMCDFAGPRLAVAGSARRGLSIELFHVAHLGIALGRMLPTIPALESDTPQIAISSFKAPRSRPERVSRRTFSIVATKIGILPGRNSPLLPQVMVMFALLSVLRTLSWLMASTTPRATKRSASRRNFQRSWPSGAGLRANAIR